MGEIMVRENEIQYKVLVMIYESSNSETQEFYTEVDRKEYIFPTLEGAIPLYMQASGYVETVLTVVDKVSEERILNRKERQKVKHLANNYNHVEDKSDKVPDLQ